LIDFWRYNASDHPIPFHKAQDLGKAPKKLAGGPAPDLEEAFVCLYDELHGAVSTDLQLQIDDIPDDEEEDAKPKESVDDISGDKLIQASKKKKAAGTTKAKRSKKS
jgi:replication factor C subunit 1